MRLRIKFGFCTCLFICILWSCGGKVDESGQKPVSDMEQSIKEERILNLALQAFLDGGEHEGMVQADALYHIYFTDRTYAKRMALTDATISSLKSSGVRFVNPDEDELFEYPMIQARLLPMNSRDPGVYVLISVQPQFNVGGGLVYQVLNEGGHMSVVSTGRRRAY